MISTVRRLIEEIERDLSRVKLEKLKGILNGLLDEIEAERRFRAELVKKDDFSELKAIVKELVDKKLIIAPFVEPGADKLASLFGMEICTNVNELE